MKTAVSNMGNEPSSCIPAAKTSGYYGPGLGAAKSCQTLHYRDGFIGFHKVSENRRQFFSGNVDLHFDFFEDSFVESSSSANHACVLLGHRNQITLIPSNDPFSFPTKYR